MKTKKMFFNIFLLIILLAENMSISFAQTRINSRSNWLEKRLDLTGKGINILLSDVGKPGSHIDFNSKYITTIGTLSVQDHTTMIAGILIGEGLIDPSTKGILRNALISCQFKNNFSVLDSNYEVSTNSWGNTLQPQDTPIKSFSGLYDGSTLYLDSRCKNFASNSNVLFATGNEGQLTKQGYFTISKSFAGAKNIIVVGAVNSNDVRSSYSSAGPIYDGRLKPDIVALGSVTSTIPENKYASGSGTSYATPIVAGVITQLREGYTKLYGKKCSGSLMKTFICNTADDLENIGPDYHTGFGRINAREAYKIIKNRWFFQDTINSQDIITHTITVPSQTRQLKVMLSWWDETGSVLINDLDLQVIDPLGNKILPLVLDPTNPSKSAVPGVDTINNIEQIVIDAPMQGNYVIKIFGKKVVVIQTAQTCEVSYDLIKDTLIVTSPIGGEYIDTHQPYVIVWDYYGDTTSFTISRSINNGKTWKAIDNAIPFNARYYDWYPDSISGTCLIRISANTSGQFAISDTTFSVMNQIELLKATSSGDSVLLNWEPYKNAKYEVFVIINGKCVLQGSTAKNSYSIDSLKSKTTYWFCIRAIDTTKNAVGEYCIAKSITTPVAINSSLRSDISIFTYGNTVVVQGCQNPEIQVYDLLGKQLLSLQNQNTITLDNYHSGVYILRVFSGNKYISKRIFIQ